MSVDPDRSETCAICGDLVDERESYLIDPYEQHKASPEAFSVIGRMFTLYESGHEGSAHFDCIMNFEKLEG